MDEVKTGPENFLLMRRFVSKAAPAVAGIVLAVMLTTRRVTLGIARRVVLLPQRSTTGELVHVAPQAVEGPPAEAAVAGVLGHVVSLAATVASRSHVGASLTVRRSCRNLTVLVMTAADAAAGVVVGLLNVVGRTVSRRR
ncbi:MAG: hypothetical protein ACRELF_24645 [Gemmataceae bacterium]